MMTSKEGNGHSGDWTEACAASPRVSIAGEAPRNEQLDVAELAAYTAVANLILNLDETITRP